MLRNHTLEERLTLSQDNKTQSDKFKEAARDLEADTDEKRWEERLKRVAKTKAAPSAPRNPIVHKKPPERD